MLRLMFLIAITGIWSLTACNRSAETQVGHSEGDGHDHARAKGGEHGHEGEAVHADEIVLTAEAVEQYGVKTAAAEAHQLQPTFVVPARIAFNSEAMAHVGSPLPGRAVELKVRLGSDVKPGDPLVVVESPELGAAQSDYLIKRTTAETKASPVDLAKAALDRAQSLYQTSQGITLTEVQRREAEHKAAIAALKSAQAEALAAENHLHLLGMTQEQVEALAASGEVHPRFTIVAPIAGQVVQREVTLGELVNPEREALLVIADMATLWVLADVPEARLHEVAIGAKTWVRIGGVQGQQHEGAVAFISPMVDATTRTAQVRIEVRRDGPLALRPGMFAQVEIAATDPAAHEAQSVVAVPDVAVQSLHGSAVVFVPDANEVNTFVPRHVKVGKAVGGLIPIYSGLAEGERLVIAGSFILKAELGKGTATHEH